MNLKRFVCNPVLQIALALLALSALSMASDVPIGRVTQIAIYTLYGAGVALLMSYSGLVPFGASVFFGIASYATSLAMLHWFRQSSELLGIAFAVLFSLVIGAFLGSIILRRRGLYFSLLTLACTQIAYEIALKWTDFTGGENGLQGVPRPTFEGAWVFHSFVCTSVIVAVWGLWRLVHSPFGRTLQALRDNEQRVASLGYDTYRIKVVAFMLSAGFIGLSGALLALMLRGAYANPLGWEHAGDSLLMLVLGGVNHFVGSLWGAIAFILLEDRLSGLMQNWWLAFAPIIMTVVLVAPQGVHGLLRRTLRLPDRWTLVRDAIPAQPAVISPFAPAVSKARRPGLPVLSVKGLSKRFGSIVVADDYDVDIMPNTLHSFIGPNGAGKTTFFNMLSGLIRPDAGRVLLDGQDISLLPMHKRVRLGLVRSFQILSVFGNLTAFENVRIAVQRSSGASWRMWSDAHSMQEVNATTWSILNAIGLADHGGVVCANLAHGQRRLLEIGITIATGARMILLDEPLAGLAEADRRSVASLLRRLTVTHTILLIEHDIDRVVEISDRLTVMHQGHLIADGLPREVAQKSEVVAAYMGNRNRDLPPTMRVARASNEVLLRARGMVAGYAGGRVLDGVTLEVRQGEIVALLGRNGVGKTTTLRTLTGVVALAEGQIIYRGRNIAGSPAHQINRLGIATVPEGRRLFPNLTVMDNLRLAARKGGISMEEVFVLFPRLQTIRNSKAENCSGGERQMVAIARTLVAPSKLILLDEPFEGLAPSVVTEVMSALLKLRGRVAMILVEHHADQVLGIADRAYVMVNGRIAYEGDADLLAVDSATQERLLGLVQASDTHETRLAEHAT